MTTRHNLSRLVFLAAVLLVGASCGGGGGGALDASSDTTASDVAEDTSASGDVTDDTSPPQDTPGSTDLTDGDTTSASIELTENCRPVPLMPMNQEPPCLRPAVNTPGTFGAGPLLGTIDEGFGAEITGGFVEDGKLIASVRWGVDQPDMRYGFVVEFDLATGDRTLVSGAFPGADGEQDTVVGAGDPFSWAVDVDRGADGDLYVLTNKPTQVFRVDPDSGDRTRVYDEETGARCTAAGLDITVSDNSMGADGDGFYFGAQDNPQTTGTGIVHFDTGFTTCTIVTLEGTDADDAGSGDEVVNGVYEDLQLAAGTLHAVHFITESVMQVDLATGARTRISSSGQSSVGEGPDVGPNALAVAPDGTYYTVKTGTPMSDITAVDPVTGDRTDIDLEGPAKFGTTRVWVHPDDPGYLLVVADRLGLAIVEAATGNSNILSY